MKRGMLALALTMVAALARAQEQPSLADVQTLQLAKGLRAIDATCADVDGDGVREVLVAIHGHGKDASRSIEIWRSTKPPAFALADTLPLTADVVAWAVGDVSSSPGSEIVLLNATGVFAWKSSGPPEQRFERLCSADVLWQLVDVDDCPLVSDCVRDVDGDGLADLAIPEPGGYRIVLQRRARTVDENGKPAPWGLESRLRLPDEFEEGLIEGSSTRSGAGMRGKHRAHEISFSFSSDEQNGGDGEDWGPHVLVHVEDSVPAPFFLDWDADRDLDVLAQTSHHLLVWKQDRGSFASAPDVTLSLPVAADRSRQLDASYSSHAVDLDGDRRADCVVFAGDQRSEDVRTQGLFFVQNSKSTAAPLFGDEGRPRDVLVFAGFVASPSFRDIDGDGLPDLTLRTVRPDLIDQLRSATSQSIEADLFVYRNVKGTLPRQPDLVWHHAIPIKNFELSSEFLADLNGDGINELFVRDDPKELRVLLVRKGKGNALSVFDRALWKLDIDEDATVEAVPVPPRAKPELLVIESQQVLYVRFK